MEQVHTLHDDDNMTITVRGDEIQFDTVPGYIPTLTAEDMDAMTDKWLEIKMSNLK